MNVVATAAFITGHNLGAGRDRIAEACRRGGSTMFGTGVSPGFAELLAIVSATICDRVDKVTINEAADTTFYDSPATEMPVGFGKPIDAPRAPGDDGEGTAVFGEAVGMVADALGVELDEFAARPSTRRPRPTSTSGRGPSRPDVSRASPPAGRDCSVTRPSSS